jgi:glutathione gamma-glutamylcysteinyltransferase
VSRVSSFYRRPLPEGHVAFSSPEGRRLFREALEAGTLEGFFALSEQFHTQAEPAYCGLGSLVMALNALGIDPGRLWKGPWRWFDETLLDCCVPLEEVRARGLTLDELGCLASCNGARVEVVRATDVSIEDLRRTLERSARTTNAVLIASYDRSVLGQTGHGHFSPVSGVHLVRDLALMLDVARFKYPPHWVSIERLYEAMLPLDPATSRARGWIELTAESRPRPIFLQLGLPSRGWAPVLERIAKHAPDPGVSLERWALAMARSVPEIGEIVHTLAEAFGSELEPEHRRLLDELLVQVRGTRTYRALVDLDDAKQSLDATALAPEALTILAHVLAPSQLHADAIEGVLGDEIAALRGQIAALCSASSTC